MLVLEAGADVYAVQRFSEDLSDGLLRRRRTLLGVAGSLRLIDLDAVCEQAALTLGAQLLEEGQTVLRGVSSYELNNGCGHRTVALRNASRAPGRRR